MTGVTVPEAPFVVSGQQLDEAEASPMPAVSDRERDVAVDAVRVLYLTLGPAVHRFLQRQLRDRVVASEALQETFARAITSYNRIQDRCEPRPFIYGIARNVASEMRKRDRRLGQRELGEDPERLNQFLSPGATPEQRAMDRQLVVALRKALDGLSEDRRTALLLRAEQGLEYREIALAMAWSVSKAKVEIMRARRSLRLTMRRQLGQAHDV